MKLYVLSDSHGSRFALEAFLLQAKGADAIAHLGDYTWDARFLAQQVQVPFYSIRGNGDFGGEPAELRIQLAETDIWMTHGHLYSVKRDLLRLQYKAEELRPQLVLFGHTHEPLIEYSNSIYYVNPGSLARPRSGENATYAVIELEKGRILPTLYSL